MIKFGDYLLKEGLTISSNEGIINIDKFVSRGMGGDVNEERLVRFCGCKTKSNKCIMKFFGPSSKGLLKTI